MPRRLRIRLLWSVVAALGAAVGVLFALDVRGPDVPPGYLYVALLFAIVTMQPPEPLDGVQRPALLTRAALLPAVGAAVGVVLLVRLVAPRALNSVTGWALPVGLAAYVAAAWVRWAATVEPDSPGA